MNTNESSTNPYEERFKKNKRLKILFLVTTIIITLISLVFAVLLVLSLTGILNIPALQIGSRSSSIKGKAFETPEDVIEQFVLAVQNNDFDSALELFAVSNMVEGYDFEANIERIGAFLPINSMAPQDYEAYTVINNTYQLDSASSQIKMFVYSLLLPEIDPTKPLFFQEIEDLNIDFLDALDPSQLDSLELVRSDYSSPEIQKSDRHQENIEKLADVFGFTDQEEYVALYEFEGDYYLGGFVLVEYETGWQISGLGAPLAGVSFYGSTNPISESEYLEIIED